MSVETHPCPFCDSQIFKVYFGEKEKWRCMECEEGNRRLIEDGCHNCTTVKWCEIEVGIGCTLKKWW